MTGSDITDWIAGILDDLLNLDTADVPLLLFKLFVLFVVLFFAWQFGRMVLRAVWSVVQPVLRMLWWIVTAPVRLPWRALQRLVVRPIGRMRHNRQRRREELAEAERVREGERTAARERAEALATAGKILDVD